MPTGDKVRSDSFFEKLGFNNFDLLLCNHRLYWINHVVCSKEPIKQVYEVMIDGSRGIGWSKITWKDKEKLGLEIAEANEAYLEINPVPASTKKHDYDLFFYSSSYQLSTYLNIMMLGWQYKWATWELSERQSGPLQG